MAYNRCVYVIWRKDGAHKIGFSANPIGRAIGLQSQVGQRTRLVHTVERPNDAPRVERIAHNLLERFWLGHEWFRVNETLAVQAVSDACIESDGIDKKIADLQRQWDAEQEAWHARTGGSASLFEEFNRWAVENPEEFEKLPLIQRYSNRRFQR